MTTIQFLSSETLSSIFELLVAQPQQGPPEDFYLPSLDGLLRNAIDLSHVCRHWRRVAVNLPQLWMYLDLTPRMCSRVKGSGQLYSDVRISIPSPLRSILRRSKQIDLHIDFQAGRPKLAAPMRLCSVRALQVFFRYGDTVARCRSLRLRGVTTAVQAVLESFQVSPVDSLVALDVVQEGPTNDRRFPYSPLNLAAISNNLISFRGQNMVIDNLVDGPMDSIVLSETRLTPNVIYQAVFISRVKHLTLRNIVVPRKEDWSVKDVAIDFPSANPPPAIRLETVELDNLSDPQELTMPWLNDEDLGYLSLYQSIFSPATINTIKTIRFQGLNKKAEKPLSTFLSFYKKAFHTVTDSQLNPRPLSWYSVKNQRTLRFEKPYFYRSFSDAHTQGNRASNTWCEEEILGQVSEKARYFPPILQRGISSL
jgi:F-box-like